MHRMIIIMTLSLLFTLAYYLSQQLLFLLFKRLNIEFESTQTQVSLDDDELKRLYEPLVVVAYVLLLVCCCIYVVVCVVDCIL